MPRDQILSITSLLIILINISLVCHLNFLSFCHLFLLSLTLNSFRLFIIFLLSVTSLLVILINISLVTFSCIILSAVPVVAHLNFLSPVYHTPLVSHSTFSYVFTTICFVCHLQFSSFCQLFIWLITSNRSPPLLFFIFHFLFSLFLLLLVVVVVVVWPTSTFFCVFRNHFLCLRS